MSGNAGASQGIDFVVRRDDLRTCDFVTGESSETDSLQRGELKLRIDKFALTSNNVTYAVFGDAMDYWEFFPADEGWGRIPVWGFGEVIDSREDGIEPGERYYGYYPMSSYLTVQAESNEAGFVDRAAHRRPLPAAYNQYLRTTSDPAYDPRHENEQMIMRPLFITSFLLADFLEDSAFFGARAVILSSASSKTAYGLAFLLSRAHERPEIIGLTSSGNKQFSEGLGIYDRVLTYSDAESLPSTMPVVYVDIAGNTPLRELLHGHFEDNMKHSALVGDTHWEENAPQSDLPGPQPSFFFAPVHLKRRTEDWGAAGLAKRFGDAWTEFVEPVGRWMKVVEGTGQSAVQRVYLELLEGRADPRDGNVLSLSRS
jgi:hypothetical protein